MSVKMIRVSETGWVRADLIRSVTVNDDEVTVFMDGDEVLVSKDDHARSWGEEIASQMGMLDMLDKGSDAPQLRVDYHATAKE